MKEFVFSQGWWQFLVIAIVCYFIGCINFALIISRKKKNDITKIGSGNPGTMNMTREFGWKVGLLTFLCDLLKGGIPTLVIWLIYKGQTFAGTDGYRVVDFMRFFAGIFIVIGHIFPVNMKFKGGKGIASTVGVFWVSLMTEAPLWGILCLAGFAGVLGLILLTKWGSFSSLTGVTTLCIVQSILLAIRYANSTVNAYMVCSFLLILSMAALDWSAHHKNLLRLFAGEEHTTTLKKSSKKK